MIVFSFVNLIEADIKLDINLLKIINLFNISVPMIRIDSRIFNYFQLTKADSVTKKNWGKYVYELKETIRTNFTIDICRLFQ